MARNRLDLDLISSVDFGSDRSDLILRAGRRRLTPVTSSAAALIGNSPDFTKTGAPGVKSTRAWVRGGLRGLRGPPRALAGLSKALGSESKVGGGSA